MREFKSMKDNTDMGTTIGDNLTAYSIIKNCLSKSQGNIIYAMSLGSGLIQVYCPERQKALWDMSGLYGIIPHQASVKVLIRKGIIVPTISDKEWKVQIALGTADERVWKINPTVLEPLQNSICLIRTIKERLEAGETFND